MGYNLTSTRVRSVAAGILPLFILAFALVAYIPGLSGSFIFDDIPALSENFLLKNVGNDFDQWRTAAFSSSAGPLSRPLTMLTFAVNVAISGEVSAFAIKMTNLLIHCVLGWLVFQLFRRLLDVLCERDKHSIDPFWIALLAASIWILHPLHVSTVLYSVQRMAQLSTLFVVLGLLVFVHFRARWTEKGGTAGEVVAVTLWLLLIGFLAVLSKENGILLFWLLPVVEVCVFSGRWERAQRHWLTVLGWSCLCLPLLVIALVFLLLPETFLSGYRVRDFTIEERLMTQARLLWTYLYWLLWPNILHMGFQHDAYPLSRSLSQPVTTVIALAGWFLVIAFAFWWRHRQPVILLALLFYLVGHSMESSFLALEMVYEHRNYLPSIGILLAVGLFFGKGLLRIKSGLRAWAAMAVILLLIVLTSLRAYSWGDDLRLARDNIARHPDSVRSTYFYANALLRTYRKRESVGLSEAKASEFLLVGRHYLEIMHQRDEADIGALAMLYYLDGLFYPQLETSPIWLESLNTVVQSRVFSASDRNALSMLFGCMGDGECATPESDVLALLEKLHRFYPNKADLVSLEYIYRQKSGAEPDVLISLLQQGLTDWPHRLEFYPRLIEQYARVDDVTAMYAVMSQWLSHDVRRRQLPAQQAMFGKTEK